MWPPISPTINTRGNNFLSEQPAEHSFHLYLQSSRVKPCSSLYDALKSRRSGSLQVGIWNSIAVEINIRDFIHTCVFINGSHSIASHRSMTYTNWSGHLTWLAFWWKMKMSVTRLEAISPLGFAFKSVSARHPQILIVADRFWSTIINHWPKPQRE